MRYTHPLGYFKDNTVMEKSHADDPAAVYLAQKDFWTSQSQDVRPWIVNPRLIDKVQKNWKPLVAVLKSGDSLLDVGCYGGYLYDYFLSQGIGLEYTGIDTNKAAIEAAHKAHGEALTFSCVDAHRVQGTWDYVMASRVLMHVPDPGALAAHLATLATKAFYFVLQNSKSTKARQQRVKSGERYLFMDTCEKDIRSWGAKRIFNAGTYSTWCINKEDNTRG